MLTFVKVLKDNPYHDPHFRPPIAINCNAGTPMNGLASVLKGAGSYQDAPSDGVGLDRADTYLLLMAQHKTPDDVTDPQLRVEYRAWLNGATLGVVKADYAAVLCDGLRESVAKGDPYHDAAGKFASKASAANPQGDEYHGTLYHGTTKNFQAYDPVQVKSGVGWATLGEGLSLTPSAQKAGEFAAKAAQKGGTAVVHIVDVHLKKPLHTGKESAGFKQEVEKVTGKPFTTHAKATADLQAKGFDGVVAWDGNKVHEVTAFAGSQHTNDSPAVEGPFYHGSDAPQMLAANSKLTGGHALYPKPGSAVWAGGPQHLAEVGVKLAKPLHVPHGVTPLAYAKTALQQPLLTGADLTGALAANGYDGVVLHNAKGEVASVHTFGKTGVTLKPKGYKAILQTPQPAKQPASPSSATTTKPPAPAAQVAPKPAAPFGHEETLKFVKNSNGSAMTDSIGGMYSGYTAHSAKASAIKGKTTGTVTVKLKNPLVMTDGDALGEKLGIPAGQASASSVAAAMQAKGHDGIVVKYPDGQTKKVVVQDKTQFAIHQPAPATPVAAVVSVAQAVGNTAKSAGFVDHDADPASTQAFRDHQYANLHGTGVFTPAETKSIRTYTGGHYGEINSALRNDSPHPDGVLIAQAMQKSTLEHDTMLYRGMRGQTSAKMRAKILANPTGYIGEILTDKGVQSSSISQHFAENWSGSNEMVIHIHAPKTQKGAYVDSISKNQGENEVLLPPGQKLQVIGVEIGKPKLSYMDNAKPHIVVHAIPVDV